MLLVLAGDGIGPEVMAPRYRVMELVRPNAAWFAIEADEALVGGAAYRRGRRAPIRRDHGDRPGRRCRAVRRGRRAQMGRAAVRSSGRARACCGCARIWSSSPICAPPCASTPLMDASTLKPEVIARPRYPDRARTDGRRLFRRAARNRDPARRPAPRRRYPGLHHREIEPHRPRRLRTGAQAQRTRCTSAEKSNVMVTGVLWREEVSPKLHDARISPMSSCTHMLRRQLRHAAGAQSQAVRRAS